MHLALHNLLPCDDSLLIFCCWSSVVILNSHRPTRFSRTKRQNHHLRLCEHHPTRTCRVTPRNGRTTSPGMCQTSNFEATNPWHGIERKRKYTSKSSTRAGPRKQVKSSESHPSKKLQPGNLEEFEQFRAQLLFCTLQLKGLR